jgi:flagellar hook-basal body complex protein FliE
MAIEAIAAISAAAPATAALPAASAAPVQGDFAAFLGEGIGNVDKGLKAADDQLRALAAGQAQAPHEVMISMEEARMNLMLLVEVRNRVVEAYQELVRMQL